MAGSEHILDLLRRDDLISDAAHCSPLSGGVSSDVFLIEDREKRFVVKQALPCLKVQDHWPADTSRNRVEYEFLKYLKQLIPGAAPQVVAAGADYFAMEYLGPEYANWKELLLRGECRQEHALRAATILGTLHRESFGNPGLVSLFDSTTNFHQLRTDPYLLTTGRRHPELRELFEREAQRLEATRECLVHGDYSPKNILIGNGRLVLLDCEVAWYGDPAFDLAFLTNHLLLKSLFHAPVDHGLQQMTTTFLEKYFEERSLPADDARELDARTARLLLMLMLARVDGKSPVEYLTGGAKDFVRTFVGSALTWSHFSMDQVISRCFSNLCLQAKH